MEQDTNANAPIVKMGDTSDVPLEEKTLSSMKLELKEQFLRDEISLEDYTKSKEQIDLKIKQLNEEKTDEKEKVRAKEGQYKKQTAERSAPKIVKTGFIAKGTTCKSCEETIKRQALKVKGVKDVSFSYEDETGRVTFDENKTDIDTILYKIEKKGYTCSILDESDSDDTGKTNKTLNTLGWIFGILGIAIVAYFTFRFVEGINLPQLSPGVSYGLLFLVGLLTGFHCIAMCGGFVVSYTAKNAQEGKKSYKPHMMYGIGKVISYTLIGAAFGLIGSIIAFTPTMRGVAGIIAGIFLVLFGLKMLNIFPVLRKIQFKTPAFLSKIVGKKSEHSSPFVIGLLNGLMIACGPLQAIYIMAAGTGSVLEGAKLLFVFALGTLPVMLGFGFFSTYISSKATQKILKASGIIVLVLGVIMLNTGLALTGTGYDAKSIAARFSISQGSQVTGNAIANSGSAAVENQGYQEIKMDVLASGWSPNKFVLKKGVPVKWIINGKELTGCNNAIQVPKLGLNFKVQPGIQTIEFTPTQEGIIPFSCWMGMIQGTFIVKENIDVTNKDAVQKELNSVPTPKGGSCGGSGGGCGCGGGL